ncbi:lipopolysaccharide biosynthesis protein [Bradyrhizobium sp. Gha]|uniref:lipopolysaccharide biosynthesis protein n=1 Tax=Bradyrhizobium sp. Gha TaxID=1855318 RepID=UPI0008E40988|nr:lipopolysaccharide biosynthesis protein [Bradyrhizobium sp. Gha]SFI17639.1 Membrane protein involved in the export of O-antigen and teichoic acid [Bradyrhizobium sp. Gha]
MTDALAARKSAGQGPMEGGARGTTSGIRRKAGFLAAAGVFEYAMQMALPVILVRHLSQQEFGDYRLMWLVAGTGLILFSLFLPQSLIYFLPRAAPGTRPKLVGNTLLSLFALGGLSVLSLLILMPVLPGSIAGLQRYSPLVQIFVGTWILASILDVLPNADGKTEWQAGITVGFAILRAAALAGAAVASADVAWVLVAMCSVAVVKVGIALVYALFAAEETGLAFDRQLVRMQLNYSLPFAVAQGLFLLRVQADQWVVAANFSSTAFALISIASTVLLVGTLTRQPLNDALLPKISSLVGAGKLDDARSLIQKGYLVLGLMLPPILGLLISTANELVELIYTREYLGAVPLMRVYLLGQMATVFAAGHLLQVFGFGRRAAMIGTISLLLSIALSILGLQFFGLAGVVAGSTTSLVVWECWALSMVAKALGTSMAQLIRLDQSFKVIVVVAVGVLVVHFLCSGLDTSVFLRLFVKSSVFVMAVGLGFVLTNMHRPLISLLRERRK